MTTHPMDPELAATLEKGRLHLVATHADLSVANHPDVVAAWKHADEAAAISHRLRKLATKTETAAQVAEQLTRDMRRAAHLVEGRVRRMPSTVEEVEAQSGPLVEALKASVVR